MAVRTVVIGIDGDLIYITGGVFPHHWWFVGVDSGSQGRN
jgi:hypothetical protein